MLFYHHVRNYPDARTRLLAVRLWLREPQERIVTVLRDGWHEITETRDLDAEEREIDRMMREVPVAMHHA